MLISLKQKLHLAKAISGILLVSSFLFTSNSHAQSGPTKLNISGGLYYPNGTAVLNSGVNFKIEILDKNASCVLYSEEHASVDLSASKGGFALQVGSGSSASNKIDGSSATALSNLVFKNSGAVAPFTGCASGVTLAAGDERLIRVYYDLGSGFTAMSPDVPVSSSAYAMVSETLQGKAASEFLQVRDDVSTDLSQTNLETIFSAVNFAKLVQILSGNFGGSVVTNVGTPTAGTDAANKNYVDANIGGRVADVTAIGPAAGNGHTLIWDQGLNRWVTGVPSATDNSKLPLAGGTMTGPIAMSAQNITNAGNITMAAQRTLNLGTYDNTQELALVGTLGLADKGKIWFNSQDNVFKVWNGSAAVNSAVPSGAAGGDLSGTYPNPDIASGVVGSAELTDLGVATGDLADGAVTNVKIANDAVSAAKINNTGIAVNRLLVTDATTGATVTYKTCGLDESLKWTASGWACTTAAAFIGNTGVTAATYGNASQVSQVQVDAQGRVVTASNVNIAFPVVSVAGKTGAVSLNIADVSGLGTAAAQNVGTSAGQVVQLDASSRVPAVDGSNLTNVNAVRLQSRDVASTAPTAAQVLTWNALASRWEPQALPAGNAGDITSVNVASATGLTGGGISGDVTLSIDVGTTTGKIVQMAASNKLPAVDGSNLTGLTASQVSGAFANNGSSFGAAATLGTNDNYGLNFETNNSTVMSLGTNGRVGIGTTSPNSVLDVRGTLGLGTGSYIWSTNQVLSNAQAGAGQRILLTLPSGPQIFDVEVRTIRGNTDYSWNSYATFKVAITHGGEVMFLLSQDIQGSGFANYQWYFDNLTGTPYLRFGHGANSFAYHVKVSSSVSGVPAIAVDAGTPPAFATVTALTALSSHTSNGFGINMNGTPAMQVNLAGNVGVGTTNPQSLLHVNGIVRATDICDENGANCKDISGGWGGGGDIDGVYSGTGLTGGFVSGSGTLSVDVGTVSGKIVQMAASNKLPAVDGSDLTNLNAVRLQTRNVSSTAPTANQVLKWNAGNSTWEPGTDNNTGGVTSVVAGSGLNGGNITSTGTLSVDTGVTNGKIVQVGASDRLPAIDGRNLTNINAVQLQTRNMASTAPTASQVLAWNAGSSSWEPQTVSISASQVSGAYAQNGNSFGAGAVLGTNDNNSLSFETNGATAMTILADGKIGVGNTNPGATFEVGTNTATTSSFRFHPHNLHQSAFRFTSDGTANWIQSGLDYTADSKKNLIFSSINGNTPWMTIQGSTGNVGIGTTAPGYLADLRASSIKSAIHISATGNDDGAYMGAISNGANFAGNAGHDGTNWIAKGTAASMMGLSNGSVRFFSNNGLTAATSFTPTERMTIEPNGIVGIGTGSPNASALLDVTSTTKGFLPPRMTTLQRTAIATPAAGLIVYDTDLTALYLYNGTTWAIMGGGVTTKWCAENDNCTGTVRACEAWTPDSRATISTAEYAIAYGAWSNPQCGISGTGWHVTSSFSTCSTGSGTGRARCRWVLVDQVGGSGGGGGGGGTGTVTSVLAGTGLTGGEITIVGTLNVDVGVTNGKIVQVGASDRLPAIDGRNLTNVNAAQLQSRNVASTAPTAGQVLAWNAGNSTWEPKTESGSASGFVQNGNSFGGAATVGTNDNYALNFETNNVTAMTILPNRNVGIGVANPGYPLDVAGDIRATTSNNWNVIMGSTYSATAGHAPVFLGYRYRGTPGAEDYPLNGDSLVGIQGRNKDGVWAGLSVQATENHASGVGGMSVQIHTPANGTATPTAKFTVNHNGNVGIGTTTPNASALLDVSSTSKGILPPRMTTVQRDAISAPAAGLTVFNTTAGQLQVFDGSVWSSASGSNTQEVTQGAAVGILGAYYDVLSMTVTTGGRYLILSNGSTYSAASWTYFSSHCRMQLNGTTIDTKNFYYGGGQNGSAAQFPFSLYSVRNLATSDVVKVQCYSTSDGAASYAGDFKITITGLGISNISGADNMGNHTLNQNLNTGNYWISGDGNAEGMRIDSTGQVGVGTATPNSPLTVEGAMTLDQLGSDFAGAVGYGSLYTKTDGKLYYRDGTGAIKDLSASGNVASVVGGTGLTGGNITGSGTLAVDVGTTTGKIVQVAASNRLPAMDGVNLTNINAIAIQSRQISSTAPTANQVLTWNAGNSTWEPKNTAASGVVSVVAGSGLTGGNITGSGTLAVDTGITANKIVQLDASARLPAIDGRNLTNVNAAQLQSRNVSATAPTAGQILGWNASNSTWEPRSDLSGVGNISASGLTLPLGSFSAPSLNFVSDPDTGIYSPGANQVGIAAGGTVSATFDSSGNINLAGNIGVRDAGPSSSAAINSAITMSANSTRYGFNNDVTIDNTAALTANRAAYGVLNDVGTSLTDANRAGFSHSLFGAYNRARGGLTASTVGAATHIYGSYNYGINQSSTAHTVTAAYGSYNYGANTGASTITNGYGSYNQYVQNNAAATTDSAFGVRSQITNTAGTMTNSYLFYGSQSGTIGNKWGIYLNGEDNNYLSGRLGIGSTSITAPLQLGNYMFLGKGAGVASTASDILFASDGVVSAEGSLDLTIDSDGNASTATFRILKDAENSTGTELFRIQENGYTGIGTATPDARLHVNGVMKLGPAPVSIVTDGVGDIITGDTTGGFHLDASANDMYIQQSTANATGVHLIGRKSRGNASAPAAVSPGDDVMLLRGFAHDGSGFVESTRITMDTEGTIANGAAPGLIKFHTANAAGTLAQRMMIDSTGFVGINTTAPQEVLDVNGTIVVRSNRMYYSHDGVTNSNNDFFTFDDANDAIAPGSTGVMYFVTDSSRGASAWTAPNTGVSAHSMYAATRVGIGTTTPRTALEVESGSPVITLTDTTSALETTAAAYTRFLTADGTRIGYVGDGSATYNNMVMVADTGMVRLITSTAQPIHFLTNGANRMTVDGSGFVGIGTTAPTKALHVTDSISSSGVALFHNTNTGTSADGMNIQIAQATPTTNNEFIKFENAGGSTIAAIRGDGAGGVQYYTASDRRIKRNIRPTQYSIEDVMRIGVRDYNPLSNDKEMTGFIAQDLYEIFPMAVRPGEGDEIWNVDYSRVTPLLTKGLQDVYGICKMSQAQIDTLNAQVQANTRDIASLKSENERLRKENAEIKNRLERIEKVLQKFQ